MSPTVAREPVGFPVTVIAKSANLAVPIARYKAHEIGLAHWRDLPVVHVERIQDHIPTTIVPLEGLGVYEVVFVVGLTAGDVS
jgi:hypothetical protein